MPVNRLLFAALAVSVFIHAVIVAGLGALAPVISGDKPGKIEVTYRKTAVMPKIKSVENENKEEFKLIKKKIGIGAKLPPQFNDYSLRPDPPRTIQKPVISEGKPVISGIKKVTMGELLSSDATLPKNPVYLNYYQAIRDKIRRYAYYNYNRAQSGDICLSFIVSADGSLKALKIIDEKSSDDDYLKEIAARSIKDASPYPPIPKELNYPEFSFNIIIAFEID